MLDGVLFLLEAALAVAGPFILVVVVLRLARRRQRGDVEKPGVSGTRRLSVSAFASGLLWLFALPMILVSRDALDSLTRAGLLRGPPTQTAPLALAVALSLVGLVLGLVGIYQIARRPRHVRGKGYAWAGVVLSWYVCVPLLVLGMPRARVNDHVQGLCGENVAWLARGLHAYAEDHAGEFPAIDSWWELTAPYLDDERGPRGTPGNCRYGYNAALSGKKLTDMGNPGRVVAVFETTPWRDVEELWAIAGDRQQLSVHPGHLEGDYYGFADGHQEWLPRRKLPDGTWAKEPDADWVVWDP